MGPRGFCYVADTAGYRDEALRSVHSVHAQMPAVPIAMVTRKDLFLPGTPVTEWIELPPGRKGPIIKTSAWLAPYERVILLDTDTFVADELYGVFDLLDSYDLAAVVDVTRGYDYELPLPRAFPESNTGVLAFRKVAAIEALFRAWERENENLCRTLGLRVLNDQASFRAALWNSPEVRLSALTNEYNFFGSTTGFAAGKVKVVHDRRARADLFAEVLNRHDGPRTFIPGLGIIRPYGGRLQWAAQFIHLTASFLKTLALPSLVRGEAAPVDWAAESEAEAAAKDRKLLG